MSHEHHHHHDHSSVKNLRAAFFLNLGFVVIELVGGLWTNSMAILSDAIHDLGDSISLGLAWYLERFSRRKGDDKFTYGYKRLSILGALFNALVLLGGTVFVVARAIPRLMHPEAVHSRGMMILAIVGILVNGAAVLRVRRGKRLSEQVVSLHLLEDVLGWVAVLIVSIVMMVVDLPILDPILSLVIALYVLKNVIGGLIRIMKMLLQGVPDGYRREDVKRAILNHHPRVESLHEMRAWSLDGESNVMTFHMVVDGQVTIPEAIEIKRSVKHQLQDMGYPYVTIEVENVNNCSETIVEQPCDKDEP